MNKRKVILVTGLSGAGKTSAMAVLEDLGYHCIDRFPDFMIDEFIHEIATQNNTLYDHLALSVSANDFEQFYVAFKNADCELVVLFLDASKEQLLLRYKYNRRNHPLIVADLANSLEEAIDAEIEEFSKIKYRASIIIDTTFLTQHNLTSRIKRFFAIDGKQTLSVSFISFGYRKGLPMDADLVFDVRFLKNPYWDEPLRKKTGNDKEVYDYVINNELTQDFLGKLTPYLDYIFAQYVDQSKHLLTVGIGCTGGQHRSVSVANWLYTYYQDDYNVYKDHRDIPEETTR